jgi:hypothetical protein
MLGNKEKKVYQKLDQKRHSAREKKPVAKDDLGYVDRDQGTRIGIC